MDVTLNSKVVNLVMLKWYIPISQWEKILPKEKEFPYGTFDYSNDKHGKKNTKVVTLYVVKKFIKQTLKWILEKHKKLNIPFLRKNGKSRLVSNMPTMLPKRELKKYNLITFNGKVIYKNSIDYYMDKLNQKTKKHTLSVEDIPFKKSIIKINKIINSLHTKQASDIEDWIR